MRTKKHCKRCGGVAPHEQVGTADCGMVWRCANCFCTTPVRKTVRRKAAEAWIALELANRS
jgi:hypothetical protein